MAVADIIDVAAGAFMVVAVAAVGFATALVGDTLPLTDGREMAEEA